MKLRHVTLDGTKVWANANKHKTMSDGRMKKAEPELAREVQRWLPEAKAALETQAVSQRAPDDDPDDPPPSPPDTRRRTLMDPAARLAAGEAVT